MKTARSALAPTLLVCVLGTLALCGWLLSLDRDAFLAVVGSDDTVEYARVANLLVETGRVPPTVRTLGYPLVLSLARLAGGEAGWPRLVVIAQLLLNLVGVALLWRQTERLVPDATPWEMGLSTLCFWWAGMGMALLLLSDFLAGLCFSLFLYVFLFLRSPRWIVAGAVSLGVATLVRPTLTFVPFLLPILAYCVGRVTSRVPWRSLLLFAAGSLAATAVSVVQQRSVDGYPGPSPILTQNIYRTLYHSTAEDEMAQVEYLRRFEATIAARAGRPYEALTRWEQEALARAMFLEELSARPVPILRLMIGTSVKYLLAPVESLVTRIAGAFLGPVRDESSWRLILFLLCLPIWILALVPPGADRMRRAYYAMTMLLLIYNVGITAINPLQGERIRYPVLGLLVPLVVWNLRRIRGFARRRRATPSRGPARA